MSLKFVFPRTLTDQELRIGYAYFCPAPNTFNSQLELIISICHQHQLTLNELNHILKKFTVYETRIYCQHCHTLKKIYEANLTAQITKQAYLCPSCQQFIQML